jgi:hypothetical protein
MHCCPLSLAQVQHMHYLPFFVRVTQPSGHQRHSTAVDPAGSETLLCLMDNSKLHIAFSDLSNDESPVIVPGTHDLTIRLSKQIRATMITQSGQDVPGIERTTHAEPLDPRDGRSYSTESRN